MCDKSHVELLLQKIRKQRRCGAEVKPTQSDGQVDSVRDKQLLKVVNASLTGRGSKNTGRAQGEKRRTSQKE